MRSLEISLCLLGIAGCIWGYYFASNRGLPDGGVANAFGVVALGIFAAMLGVAAWG